MLVRPKGILALYARVCAFPEGMESLNLLAKLSNQSDLNRTNFRDILDIWVRVNNLSLLELEICVKNIVAISNGSFKFALVVNRGQVWSTVM